MKLLRSQNLWKVNDLLKIEFLSFIKFPLVVIGNKPKPWGIKGGAENQLGYCFYDTTA